MESVETLGIRQNVAIGEEVSNDLVELTGAYADDFDKLIEEHQAGLIRYAYRMVKNRELAHGMVQVHGRQGQG